MTDVKKTLHVRYTIDLEVEARQFPEPLPIWELLEDHERRNRAMDALLQSADFDSILRYVVLRNKSLVAMLADQLKIPTPPQLLDAANEAGDRELVEYLAREGDYPPPEGEPARLLEDTLSRFFLMSATIAQSEIRESSNLETI